MVVVSSIIAFFWQRRPPGSYRLQYIMLGQIVGENLLNLKSDMTPLVNRQLRCEDRNAKRT